MVHRVLIVDDNPDDREVIHRALKDAPEVGLPVLEAVDEASCFEQLNQDLEIECVLLDYSLPGRDGLKLLERIVEQYPSMAVVMLTGQGSEGIAVEAMKGGAQDYLSKDHLTDKNLQHAVANATERAGMLNKIREQQESLQSFAQVIVHDLRAPLRSIWQAIEMLNEDLPEAVVTENSDMLDYVAQGAHRMDALIVALKIYTEVDGTLPTFEPVDLKEQVDATCETLNAVIKERGAQVKCESALPIVLGHPPQIGQLLQNLIGNGIKYNRSEEPEIRITSTETDDHWSVEISDNGIGIETQFLQRIFEPFKRLHGQSEFEGTGLGLATCKKIAERHNGTLGCQSEPDSGSTFTFVVPKASL